jgi:YD repeat-containing protein
MNFIFNYFTLWLLLCGLTVNGQNQSKYIYDHQGRLITAYLPKCVKYEYGYDEDGNRTNFAVSKIDITAQIGDNTCLDGMQGSIALSSSNSHLSYQWSNGFSGNTLSNLTSGLYTVTINDAQNSNSCIQSFEVKQPEALHISVLTQAVTCHGGNNGFAIIDTSGSGLNNFVVTWSNGEHGISTANLPVGNNFAQISNIATGCIETKYFTTMDTTSFIQSLVTNPASCFGYNDGFGLINVMGNPSNYSFNWPNGSTSYAQSNLQAGTYSVSITNMANCTEIVSMVINEPSKIVSADSVTNACIGGARGLITSNASGGIAPYQFALNNGTFQVSNTFSNLSPGVYALSIRDAHFCQKDFNITVNEVICSTATSDELTSIWNKIYPSPTGGDFFVEFGTEQGEHYEITVLNVIGEIMKIVSGDATSDSLKIRLTLSTLPSGLYYIKCFTKNNSFMQPLEIQH